MWTLAPPKTRMRSFSSDPKEKQLLINVLLHSHISNMVRPLQISRRWCDLVFEEFLSQARLRAVFASRLTSYCNESG